MFKGRGGPKIDKAFYSNVSLHDIPSITWRQVLVFFMRATDCLKWISPHGSGFHFQWLYFMTPDGHANLIDDYRENRTQNYCDDDAILSTTGNVW